MRNLLGPLVVAWLAVAWSWQARAQPRDLSTFVVPAGAATTFLIEAPEVPRHATLHLGAALDYAHGLLDRVVDCNAPALSPGSTCAPGKLEARSPLVSDLARLDVLASLALFDAFSLGVSLPVVLTRAADPGFTSSQLENHAGLGDLRLAFSAPLISGPTSLLVVLDAILPTASAQTWSGGQRVGAGSALLLSHAFSRLTLAAKLGYVLRRRVTVLDVTDQDQLVPVLGAAYRITQNVSWIMDLQAHMGMGSQVFSPTQTPLEADTGIRVGSHQGPQVELGVGTGAWPGQAGYGAPQVRIFAAIRSAWTSTGCTQGPEDYDGFDDADGCADPDNDRDGVLDERDACPNDAEDRDGFADDDGCPDLDNDADGVPDAHDLCPNQAEDHDGYQDQDGCPEPDNDEDGIPDGRDACPMDPEDRDGFEDQDGCPEPGPGRPMITVQGSRLLLSDRIYFDDDADTIRSVSIPVLDELAAVAGTLLVHKRLRVEGHTDDTGNAPHNLDLSYRRARAVVEYLKARGVPADRLEYVGHGAQTPLAPNESAAGRALNRRVEFTILDQR